MGFHVFYFLEKYSEKATITDATITLQNTANGKKNHTACRLGGVVYKPGSLVAANCYGPKEDRLANRIFLTNNAKEQNIFICEVEVYGKR